MTATFANWTVLIGIFVVCLAVFRALIIDYIYHTKKQDKIFFRCINAGFGIFFLMTAITIVLVFLGVE